MDGSLDLPVETPPALLLRRLISSYRITRVIAVATQLGVADHLEIPKSAAELAGPLGVNADALHRLLRVLVSLGLLEDAADGRFALTPVGACLRSDAPGGMRSWALCEDADYYQRAWKDLLHAVRTGETAFEHAHGMNFYQYLAEHSEIGRSFSQGMVDLARLIAEALVSGYDFSRVRRVVDVGGSHGRVLLAILQANPGLSGVLFDRPAVIERTAELIRESGLEDRCEMASGDFFESVPAGGDLYVLSRILMDHEDERCVRLLRNCHRAMAPQGRVLIVQMVVPPQGSDAPREALFEAVISDLNMLVLTGGRERTREEYRVLLERAGFRMGRIIPSQALVSFIEGVRISN